MCYYNGQKVSKAEFIRLMELEKAVRDYDFLDNSVQNGFAYQPIAVLKATEDKTNFDIVQMEWGFIPHYIQDREEVNQMRGGYVDANGKFRKYDMLNARGNEILQPRKVFRDAALKRRCLILSTGFFEWREIFHANKRTGLPVKTPTKYPYYINLPEHEYFYMAAVWQGWTDKSTGEYVETTAICTTDANPLMKAVHNSKKRMPTILPDALAWEWMMGDLSEERINELVNYQYDWQGMQACSVAKDFRQKLEPAEPFYYNDLPALEVSF